MRFISLLLLLTLPLFGNLKHKDIIDLFEDTALSWSSGSTSLSSKDQKLCKKRTDDINIYLNGYWNNEYKSEVSRAMGILQKLVNIEMKFSAPSDSDFLLIYDDPEIFSSKIEIKKNFQSSLNYFWYIYYSNTNPFSISEGYGFINNKQVSDNFVYNSSLKILIGTLGFTNSTSSWKYRDTFFYSFLGPNHGDKQLTELDKAVIKLLYQDSLKPGMNIREIKRVCSENNLLEKVAAL